MTRNRMLNMSERWFRFLQRLYPPDFRDEMGNAVVEAYMDRTRDALTNSGKIHLIALWLRAFVDSLRNGAAERVRPAASWRRAGNWGRDVELVRRRLVRSPAFASTTIGTLTIGLGMFAVVFTAVQKVLIDPMPYKNPGDLYYVWRDYGPVVDLRRGWLGGTDIAELQKTNPVIQDAAGLQPFLGGIFSLREGADPMEIAVTRTSPNLFNLLGIAPALGRGFAPDEVGPGREQVIVLTHHLWTRLGADPGIVGTDVRLQGRPFTVIGVLPPEFTFVRNDAAAPPQRVDAFIPFAVRLAETNPQQGAYVGLIRARHGASPDAVAAAVDVVGRAIDARDFNSRGLKLYPVGLKADVISRIRPALVVLGAAGLVLVLMLMVNLASVLLARAAQREREVAVSRALGALLLAAMGLFGVVSGSVTRRRHELAVRLALGADHSRVLRLVLKEGALLVMAGLLIGAPGIYIANGLIRGLLVGVSPSDPLTLLAAALGLLLVTMATCYVPARRALRIEPAQLLREE